MPKQDDALKILSRAGRLGNKEVVVPEDPELLKKYGLTGNTGARYNFRDDTIYVRKKFDTPETNRHELLHRGQASFLRRTPKLSDFFKTRFVPNSAVSELSKKGYTALEIPFEWPSYRFQEPAEKNDVREQEDFYKYLDLVRRLNPQRTSAFEAHLPQDYLEQMVKTRPMPNYYPRPQMSPDRRSVWDIIKEMVK